MQREKFCDILSKIDVSLDDTQLDQLNYSIIRFLLSGMSL